MESPLDAAADGAAGRMDMDMDMGMDMGGCVMGLAEEQQQQQQEEQEEEEDYYARLRSRVFSDLGALQSALAGVGSEVQRLETLLAARADGAEHEEAILDGEAVDSPTTGVLLARSARYKDESEEDDAGERQEEGAAQPTEQGAETEPTLLQQQPQKHHPERQPPQQQAGDPAAAVAGTTGAVRGAELEVPPSPGSPDDDAATPMPPVPPQAQAQEPSVEHLADEPRHGAEEGQDEEMLTGMDAVRALIAQDGGDGADGGDLDELQYSRELLDSGIDPQEEMARMREEERAMAAARRRQEHEAGGSFVAEGQEDLDDDDGALDEWQDDNDCGYVLVSLSEEDFFDYEQKAAEAVQAAKLAKRYDEEGTQQQQQDPGTTVDQDGLTKQTTSTRKSTDSTNSVAATMQTLAPNPESPGSSSATDIGGSPDTDVANGRSSSGTTKANGSNTAAPAAATNTENDDDDNDVGVDVMTNGKAQQNGQESDGLMTTPQTKKKEGTGEAGADASMAGGGTGDGKSTYSPINGQHLVEGTNGSLGFFDLRVVFEPHRTGFEESKDFMPPAGAMVGGRYRVEATLGHAAFSMALQCVDMNVVDDDTSEPLPVCLKVIKNNKDFFDQSLDEIKLLQYINSMGDPDEYHVLRMFDYFYYKEHLIIVSELLQDNLYEFGKYINEQGLEPYFTFPRLKKIMIQCFEAMEFIHSLRLIHCDIKPENIVIRSRSRCEVKVIDFGSSCYVTDHLTSYVQSRSYRAPEVILGLPYDQKIDNWSLGSVLAELFTNYVLFQNESVPTMLARIQGMVGPYPDDMLDRGKEVPKFFTSDNVVYERNEDTGGFFLIYPKKTTLAQRLHTKDPVFLDFVQQLLHIDPSKRLSASEALRHPWLQDLNEDDVYYDTSVLYR